MNRWLCLLFLALLTPCESALGQVLSQKAAVALAERFVVRNGYTDAPPDQVKHDLDFESIEFAENREAMLRQRRNTLRPRAIGVRRGRRSSKSGWSVAFDFVESIDANRGSCRVVTMDSDGSNIRIEHVDGLRKFFVGFNEPVAYEPIRPKLPH